MLEVMLSEMEADELSLYETDIVENDLCSCCGRKLDLDDVNGGVGLCWECRLEEN